MFQVPKYFWGHFSLFFWALIAYKMIATGDFFKQGTLELKKNESRLILVDFDDLSIRSKHILLELFG